MEVQRDSLHDLNVNIQIGPGKSAVERLAVWPSCWSTGSQEKLSFAPCFVLAGW